MLRKLYLWFALAAFASLNVGGEALHHAEIFGFHGHGGVTSCGCVHHRSGSSHERDGVKDGNVEQGQTCALCQYYSQAKPEESEHGPRVDFPLPSAEELSKPVTMLASFARLDWSARGPPSA